MECGMQASDRIGRRLKLHSLHVLMAVAQAGSMGKAAHRLSTSQPNISRSIAELEHALGVRLLDRQRQGIVPTEYGQALLDRCVTVFDELRQGVKSIEFLADPAAGEVRIGCNPFIAASFVSSVIDRMSKQYPRIRFHVVGAEADLLHRDVRERKIDLLVAWRFDPGGSGDDDLLFEALYDDRYAVMADAKNPWTRRRRIKLTELMNESWALPSPDTVLGSVVTAAFRASGLNFPSVAVSSLTPEVRISLLATGRFLTVFPTSVLRFAAGRADIKLLPVQLPMARLSLGVVTLKGRTLTPAAQLFIDFARQAAKPFAVRK
jgi:DNA-binding transcriptional LysR family regulator